MVVATARATGREVVAILDDDPARFGSVFEGIVVTGPIFDALEVLENAEPIIAIGDNAVRARIASTIHLPFATLVHPFSWIAPDVVIEEGTVVFAGSVIHPSTRIGRHCVLNTSCSVDHDGRLEAFVQVAPGARLAGGVTAREGAYVGMGACVIQGLELGPWSVIGAGAAVVRDVPARTLVKGVPARP